MNVLLVATFMLGQKLLELNSEEERLEDKGHNYSHHDHSKHIEAHEEKSAPISFRHVCVALHDNVPIIDN